MKSKPWYKSRTIWGAIGWGLVITLEQLGVEFPVLTAIAKGLSTILVGWGIRRAIE